VCVRGEPHRDKRETYLTPSKVLTKAVHALDTAVAVCEQAQVVLNKEELERGDLALGALWLLLLLLLAWLLAMWCRL